MFAGDDMDV